MLERNLLNKMGSFLSKEDIRAVIGIDIGFNDIKMARFARGTGATAWQFESAQVFVLKQSAEGSQKDEELSQILKNILANSQPKHTAITCFVADSNCVEKLILTPLMDRNELKEAISWKMKDFIHFPLEEANIDFKIVGKIEVENETKDEILAVALPKAVSDNWLNIFRETKLSPAALYSLSSCIEHNLDNLEIGKEETVAFLDLGARHSQLVIFKNRKFAFSRQIPVSGNSITSSMSTVLDSQSGRIAMTFEEAEKIKKECGIPGSSNEPITGKHITCNQLLSLVRPEIEKLASEIEHSFAYYLEEFAAVKVERLILLGAGARLKGLDKFLAQQLSIKVEIAEPFKGKFFKAQDRFKEIPEPNAFFGCAGAAQALIAQMESGRREINLLPAKIKELSKLLVRRLILEVVATVLVLSAFLTYVGTKIAIAGIKKKLGAVQAQVYSLSYLQREASLRSFISQIYMREPRWQEVWRELSNCLPANVYLERLYYSSDDFLLEGAVVAKLGSSESTISEFMLSLEKGIFKSVSLIESRNVRDEQGASRTEFKIRCLLE